MGRDEEAVSVGPLAGIKIVELAGIGPGPMCAMLLADLGADRAAHRSQAARRSSASSARCSYNLLLRSRTTIALDLKKPAAVETVLRSDRAGRCADRRLSPRRHRATRTRPRRVSRAQSAPGLRPHDRLGTERAARADGRARPQLHRDHRRAERDRPQGSAAQRAAQPDRRLCAAARCTWRSACSPPSSKHAQSGKGQVVDAAIVDGAASLATTFFGMHAAGMLQPETRHAT